MPNYEQHDDRTSPFADPSLQGLVGEKIEQLRKRLLDFSRRNPLVHITFRATNNSLIRVVDELPDILRLTLESEGEMRLVPLPPIDVDPKDEVTSKFLDALFLARREDELYVAAMDELDPQDSKALDKERQLERELKDRLRARLGLPKLQGKDAISLVDHARDQDINPSFDLPHPGERHEDGRHEDSGIQTLVLPDRLRRAGKAILTRGKAIEREIGVNVQHAVFGFLEWKHPEEKDSHFSPLVLMEVNFDRRSAVSGEEFWVRSTGAPTTNTTLREKLLVEHRLELPEYEGGSIEEYFDAIRDKAPKGWDWRMRRQVVFGIFPSSRMAMYHDLDPSKRKLGAKELIARLLASAGGSAPGVYAEDYEPDALEFQNTAPFVVRDADASQWSAIVDVLNGKNVAIEGPPGSGKSQTIVNIVAACLAANKRVLFVAEKLTALDVVKSRIEAAGLGEFVLALQAGKSSSEQVYSSIEDRLQLATEADAQSTENFRRRKEQLQSRKLQLQGYLDVLSSTFGSSGMTVHEILGRSVKSAAARDGLPRDIRRLIVPNIAKVTKAGVEDIVSNAAGLSSALSRAEHIPALWMKADADVTTREDAEDIAEEAKLLASSIRALKTHFDGSCFFAFGKDGWKTLRFRTVLPILERVQGVLDRIGKSTTLFLLDAKNQERALDFSNKYVVATLARQALAHNIQKPESARQVVEHAISVAMANGGVIDPLRLERELTNQKNDASIMMYMNDVFNLLGPQWRKAGITIGQLYQLRSAILEAPEEVVLLNSLGTHEDVLREIATFEARRTAVLRKFEDMKAVLPHIGDHSVETAMSAADVIEGAGFFARLGGSYKAAISFYRDELGGDVRSPKPRVVRLLRDYASWLTERSALNEPSLIARFGVNFRGYDTDPKRIAACRNYVEQVHQILGNWPDICHEVLNGSAKKFLTFDLHETLPDLDYEAVEASLARHNIAVESLSQCLAVMRSARAAFSGIGSITLLKLQELLATIETSERLFEEIAEISVGLPKQLIEAPDQIGEFVEVVAELSLAIGLSFAGAVLQGDGLFEQISAARELAIRQAEILDTGRSLHAAAGLRDFPHDLEGLTDKIDLLDRAAAEPYALLDRVSVRRAEKRLRDEGLDALVDWVISPGNEAEIEGLADRVAAILSKNFADAVYDAHGDTLRGYSGSELNAIRKDIAAKDREFIELTRLVVRSKVIGAANPPSGTGVGKKSDFTEMALIRNEFGKRRRRVSIRELTRRSWRSLMELKPCWMMSPLAVSQFLLPQAQFDVVIIDEASQMTPENALGAISRAKQAVIVGDTKQLPPTSFFSRMIDDSDVDEDLREDAESILDLANLAFMPMRQLRWHYRSQHADLIRFSNHWMYDRKLTIFPSADQSHAGLGVELVRVDGTYSGQTNVQEAHKVVQAAVRLMEENPDVSLGICTMNTKQRDLIDEEMDRERLLNPHVQAYMSSWEERNDGLEGFFVKNLEAIQGDERDVMFISTLYGPASLGTKTHQRFGPINTVQGHRRLNVLFSRAKKKIVTFTSMDPTDILLDEGKSKGVQMLRNWLEYCKTGQLAENASENGGPDSPFEEHVSAVVQSLGFEAVPQVGTAGYRIDIGVRHPDWVHGFIAGIECDGATYHSSRSARDRDRLREEILQGLGWTLHRIWSTDWFTNPQIERERLKDFLCDRLATLKALPERKLVSSFNDVLSQPSRPARIQSRTVSPSLGVNRRPVRGITQPDFFSTSGFQPVHKAPPVKPDGRKRVDVGSIVTVRQNGEEKTYTVSPNENDPSRGILRKDVPLALAMFDLEEGDEFEFAAGANVRTAWIVKIV